MNIYSKYGPWACVGGAAEGLGAAFSKVLAGKGFSLVLVDQNQEALLELANSLEKEHDCTVIPMVHDLADRRSLDPVMTRIREVNARFLIYNAAYGPVRPFLQNTPGQLDTYLDVNVATPLHLAHRYCALHQHGTAGMLWLSSLAGFRGTRFVVPYAGTKAFSWNVAEGLHYEFKKTGLDFSVCCPGTTDTPGFRSSNPQPHWLAPEPMDPMDVAREALDVFGKRIFIIPGLSNKMSHYFMTRVLPRRLASGIHNTVMGKIYRWIG